MKTSKIIIFLCIVTLIFVFLIKFDVLAVLKTPSESMQIPSSEMQIVVEKAKSGDVVSTNRLVNHYLISEGDEVIGLQWARLAAEQGNLDARKYVVDVLSRSNLETDRKESKKLAEQWNLPIQKVE